MHLNGWCFLLVIPNIFSAYFVLHIHSAYSLLVHNLHLFLHSWKFKFLNSISLSTSRSIPPPSFSLSYSVFFSLFFTLIFLIYICLLVTLFLSLSFNIVNFHFICFLFLFLPYSLFSFFYSEFFLSSPFFFLLIYSGRTSIFKLGKGWEIRRERESVRGKYKNVKGKTINLREREREVERYKKEVEGVGEKKMWDDLKLFLFIKYGIVWNIEIEWKWRGSVWDEKVWINRRERVRSKEK